MIQKYLNTHIQKRVQVHMEPVKLSFGNVAKDIQRLDVFVKESRQLMERWNQYFLHTLDKLSRMHPDPKVIDHARQVPKLHAEIGQIHDAHTSLFQSLTKQQDAIETLRRDMGHMHENMSHVVSQYNKYFHSLFDEIKDLKAQIHSQNELIAQQKLVEMPQIEQIHTVSRIESESSQRKQHTGSSTLKQLADSLTTSERAILAILVSTDQKLSYKDISVSYGRSPSTIKNIICRLKSKKIPLFETAGSDGVKRYFLDDRFKATITSGKI